MIPSRTYHELWNLKYFFRQKLKHETYEWVKTLYYLVILKIKFVNFEVLIYFIPVTIFAVLLIAEVKTVYIIHFTFKENHFDIPVKIIFGQKVCYRVFVHIIDMKYIKLSALT